MSFLEFVSKASFGMDLKICLISTEYLPTPPMGFWGGVESVVDDLANALHELGQDVTLVGRRGSKSPDKLFETFAYAPPNQQVEQHFLQYRRLVENFDGVVHDHSHGKMARLIHNKVIQTVHRRQHPMEMGYKSIVAISHAQSNWLGQRCPFPRDVPVVYHGVNPNRFPFQEEKSDRFLYFSVISQYKGAKVALDIAKETGIKMDFAGVDGDFTWAVQNCNLSNVRYLGRVSDEQRAKLMANAKAFIFPTGAFGGFDWLECFGLVMLESLACGTPVIAAHNGATPEVIEQGKVGFVCHNKNEMIEAIEKIEDINPRDCRKHVENRFSHKTMALNYMRLYKRVLKGQTWSCTFLPTGSLKVLDFGVKKNPLLRKIKTELVSHRRVRK